MPLLSLRNIALHFGTTVLLDGANFIIDRGERVCLVGRNGAGKSTLMKLLLRDVAPDGGEIECDRSTKIAALPQDVPEGIEGNIFSVVATGAGSMGRWLSEYQTLAHAMSAGDEITLSELQHKIEDGNGWSLNQRIEAILSRMQLNPDQLFATLSGGLKRRVLLAQAIVQEPDILLLDEPTNHFDVNAIEWLESFLRDYNGAILFITHDRELLKKLATRIVDLDRGKLVSFPGDYNQYLERKQEILDAEEKQNALFDKRLAQEEVWIRQGIKARRTRNEGRVRKLIELRNQRAQRREVVGKVEINMSQSGSSGAIVIEAEKISHSITGQALIRHFSSTIRRGDKIGILGPNGAGKSTLLRILLKELAPDNGNVKHGTQLKIAYFDQLRAVLDLEKSVRDNIAEGSDHVEIDGKPKHIIGYLADFLFSAERARTPVKALSGGERNRLLLAKLFARPANLIVMDEPTNDLDIETLELLEARLVEYTGTLLLVSHDRAFINNVVTSCMVFEGAGKIAEYVGSYDDWLRQRPTTPTTTSNKKIEAAPPIQATTPLSTQHATRKKLSYKEQRELDCLPGKIEQLEQEQTTLAAQISDPSFFKRPADEVRKIQQRLSDLETELNEAYQRWALLEG